MRIHLPVPLLLLGACQVTQGRAITTMTVAYNEDVADNARGRRRQRGGRSGAKIANDVQATADKVENKVGDVDVDVNVSNKATASTNAISFSRRPARC